MAKDVLARGGRSAQFGGPVGISQQTWDAIWKPQEPEDPKKLNGKPSKQQSDNSNKSPSHEL